MSSTEFTVGIGEGCRMSSKVLKPPGGGSSDIFGLENSSAQGPFSENGMVNSSTHSRLFGQSENSQLSVSQTNLPDTNEKLSSQTKKIYETEEVPSKSIQTSIRVRNPPGGKSSGIF